MAGLHFEDFSEGQEFVHAWSRTVTEMDNTLFSLLTMNPQPLHIDAQRARTRVISVRASKSRPDAGLVEFEHTALNQRDEVVAVCRRTAMMKRRPAK